MPEADQPSRIGTNYVQEGILSSLGKASTGARLGQDSLVQDPDADLRVLLGTSGVTGRLGGIEVPGEAGPSRADLIEELIVLKWSGPGDLLHGRLHRLLNHRRSPREGLGQGFHVQGHNQPLPADSRMQNNDADASDGIGSVRDESAVPGRPDGGGDRGRYYGGTRQIGKNP